MPKKIVESPFQALEEEAYHAFREWPLWLVLRERELDAHLKAQRPPEAQNSRSTPEKHDSHSTLDEKGN
jgi:hypothetical protein